MPSAARKTCLLISLQAPRVPGGGGEVRSHFLVAAASRLFDVTLVSLGGSDGAGCVTPALAAQCRMVIQPGSKVVAAGSASGRTRSRSRIEAWWRLLLTLLLPWRNQWTDFFGLVLQYAVPAPASDNRLLCWLIRLELHLISIWLPMPPATSLLFSGAWQNVRVQAEALASQQQFDVIWVEHTLVWPFAERLLRLQKGSRPFVICSGHNVEHHVLQRQARSAAHGPGRWYLWRQVCLMQRMEQAAWSASNLIVQCSENDAQYTRRCVPRTSVLVMPNGVDTDYFRRRSTLPTEPSPTLVLTAGFGYVPNLEGLQWFLRDVFPLVQQKVPEVSFLFAGSCAAAAAHVCAPLPKGVRYVSDPADIRPAFECGWVYVVPLLSGGGSRLKILEAMAMQVPVVSTTLGAEGIPYRSGQDLLLADGAEEFANAVLRLLQQANLRREIVDSAAGFVLDGFTWDRLCRGVESEIERALQSSPFLSSFRGCTAQCEEVGERTCNPLL